MQSLAVPFETVQVPYANGRFLPGYFVKPEPRATR
ncbi:hypothetical protein ABIA38_005557 [Embleya sp. AB8]